MTFDLGRFQLDEQQRYLWLPGLAGCLALFTTRRGGVSRAPFASLNLGFHVGDRDEDVLENRRRALEWMGCGLESLVAAVQVHGVKVAQIGSDQRGAGAFGQGGALPGHDAMVTNQCGVVLSIYTADCVPVLLWDPEHQALGVAHAGWRGTVGGVLEQTLQEMAAAFGTRSSRVVAALGPGIGPCCFRVGEETARAFRQQYPQEDARRPVCQRLADGWHVDLWEANRQALLRAGVSAEAVSVARVCTACHPEWFFSYRRDGGRTGRMGLLATIRPCAAAR
ncbi:MAG: peptidoglycan editing factor PgeF [Firmicutes bacterium]|nr:peptidoglycan editing factor PgeF [Bacillota bacterium]